MSTSGSNLPIPITSVDSSLGGTKLTPQISECFEVSYSKLLERNEMQERANEIIGDMTTILTASEENLSEVKNQKAFKRAWNTITGKNKKLERVTSSNLLKVQKGAVFFLQNIAETNSQMMETVVKALQRVEDLQLESIKLKGYLKQLVNKYNARISQIEERLDMHEEVISNIQVKSHTLSVVSITCAVVILSVVLHLVIEDRMVWFILSSVLLITGAVAIYSFTKFQRKRSRGFSNSGVLVKQNPELANRSKVQIHNAELIPDIELLVARVINYYVYNNVLANPYMELIDQNESIFNLCNQMSEAVENSDKKEVGRIVDNIIHIEPESLSKILYNLRNCVSMYCAFYNSLLSEIQREFLPNSIGLDVITNLDQDFNFRVSKDLETAILPYENHFNDLTDLKRDLERDLRQFQKLMNESLASEIGKGFLEGFTFGIYRPSSNDVDYINSYLKLIYSYQNRLNDLSSIIANSVVALNERTYEQMTSEAVATMGPMWEQFNKDGISLQSLYDELCEEVKELERNSNTT